MTTVTLSRANEFCVGDQIVISGLTPRLPQWVTKWPWQDGDRAIVRWFYKVVGWKLPTGFKGRITGVSQTRFTIGGRR